MDLGKQAHGKLRKVSRKRFRPRRGKPLWKTRILTEKTGACHRIEYGV
jgi:hypothetical protein